ncbi:hypothetical protein [Kitasatospora sp. NPDC048407]|uniref:hypothetical protein n=1 Tax=Kitasatospora sp. NPDC048407 TaxID=3364051 RepID=UPI0037241020
MAWLILPGLVVVFLVLPVARGSVRRVRAAERGLMFRRGRLQERVVPPGFVLMVPWVDSRRG